jgi:hypothetical protein
MKKASMHYILDVIEGLILLLVIISGFILWLALPEGSTAEKIIIFPRNIWINIHQWLAVGLIIFFSTHIITHWTWISYMTRTYFKKFRSR